MRDEEILARHWDTLPELLRYRRESLGLTHRDIEKKTIGNGPRVVNRGAYGRIEGGYWVPKDPLVLQAIALALNLDENVLVNIAERTRMSPQILNRDYRRVVDLLQAMVAAMNDNEKAMMIRCLEQKIGLFKEPLPKLARNFVDLWKGDLGIDAEPPNGLRPLRHYLRPFCQDDVMPLKKESRENTY